VGDRDIVAKAGGHAFCDFVEQDAGGIGGDDGAVFPRRFDFFKQATFDRKIFDDHFDDPIDLAQAGHVVFEIADLDALAVAGVIQHRGAAFAHHRLGVDRHGVAVAFFCRHVHEQHVQALTGTKCGNTGPHGAGAEDGDFFDFPAHKRLLHTQGVFIDVQQGILFLDVFFVHFAKLDDLAHDFNVETGPFGFRKYFFDVGGQGCLFLFQAFDPFDELAQMLACDTAMFDHASKSPELFRFRPGRKGARTYRSRTLGATTESWSLSHGAT
jgi:hypothetical protein